MAKFVLRHLGGIALCLLLVTTGWGLYERLPFEPRWQIAVDPRFREFHSHWDSATGTVRVIPSSTFFRSSVSGGPILVFDTSTGILSAKYSDESEQFDDFHYSPDGRFALGAGKNLVRWVDFAVGEQAIIPLDTGEQNPFLPENARISLQFSKTGDHFLATFDDGAGNEWVAALFRTGDRNKIWQAKVDYPSPCFLLDAERFVYALSGMRDEVRIRSLNGGETVVPASISWILKHEQIVLGTEEGEPQSSLWDLGNPKGPKRLFTSSTLAAGNIWGISRDGHYCHFGSQVWDLSTGKLCLRHDTWPLCETLTDAFTPDSRGLGLLFVQDENESFSVLDIESGKLRWKHPTNLYERFPVILPKAGERVPVMLALGLVKTTPLFTSDSRSVIVKGAGRTIDILDADDGRVQAQIPVLYGTVKDPMLTPDDRFLLVYCQQKDAHKVPQKDWFSRLLDKLVGRWAPISLDLVSVWDLQTYKEVFRLDDRDASCAAISPDGKTVLTSSFATDGCVLTCWDVPGKRPWRWIVGIPVGMGLALIGARQAWRRWRGRKPATA